MATHTHSPGDSRRPRSRFNWVRRLVLGPNRPTSQPTISVNGHHHQSQRTPSHTHTDNSTNDRNRRQQEHGHTRQTVHSGHSFTSDYENNDQITTHTNDNVSTIPLKSLSSMSTKSVNNSSLYDTNAADDVSYNASTAETSITPSTTTSPINGHVHSQQLPPLIQPERDSDSIITLASSSRRLRRRSLDTNCSTTGIAPASIMERITVNSPSMTNNSSATNLALPLDSLKGDE